MGIAKESDRFAAFRAPRRPISIRAFSHALRERSTMNPPFQNVVSPRMGKGRILVLWAFLALLTGNSAVQAQPKILASLDRTNRKLAGQVVDYTQNHGCDRRIPSAILGMPRDLYVYLPPGYTPQNAYPLALYLHVASVDEHIFIATNWVAQLDRMIQQGEIPPMIVACPDGLIDGQKHRGSKHSFYLNGEMGRFQDHILYEVIPFLTKTYSIRPEREAHGILGTSAGGLGAMNLALKHREYFGAVAALAGPMNMRYSNKDGDVREDFDPATYMWKEDYDPDEIVGVFYFGLSRVPAKKYMRPVFGDGPQVPSRIAAENPADLLFTTDLKPGELAIYINYPGRDNWNFDAQAQSFAWLANQKGIALTIECDPHEKHTLRYLRRNHEPAYRWLGQHLLPPIAVASKP